jgi:hypothetical protein
MGWQFRKKIHIAPGLDVNVGKKSISVSTDIGGAHVTTGTRGTTVSSGDVGGTGLSYSEKLNKKNAENAGNWFQLILSLILKAFFKK